MHRKLAGLREAKLPEFPAVKAHKTVLDVTRKKTACAKHAFPYFHCYSRH